MSVRMVWGIPFLFLVIAVSTALPYFASAQSGGGVPAGQCLPWNAACPCGAGINPGPKPPPCTVGGPNKANCPPGICKKVVNGFPTEGICTSPGFCHGVQSAGGGGELGAGQQLLQMAKQIADMLKGGGGGGGGGGGAPPPTDSFPPPGGQASCTNFYTVTVQSTDPCAIYNPSFISDTGDSSISDSLLNSLNEQPVSDVLSQPGSSTSTPVEDQKTATTTVPGDAASLTPDITGDVRLGNAGATVFANLKQGLSEIAGFFGASSQNTGQAASLAGRMCANRPWAGGMLSSVIPASFFDGLCRFGGYQVGVITPTTSPSTALKAVITTPKVQTTTTIQRTNTGVPEVDMWAEPASVRLGTRTYIFWTSKNVDSCKAEGPSFSHNTPSGGASTVPITDATIFSIECTAPDGSKVTDSVTVNLKI